MIQSPFQFQSQEVSPSLVGASITRRRWKFKLDTEYERISYGVFGPLGTVNFMFGPSEIPEELQEKIPMGGYIDGIHIFPWDLGYHRSEETEYGMHNTVCPFRDDESCWYDGTSLGASKLLDAWIGNGCSDEWLYRHLENRYQDWVT